MKRKMPGLCLYFNKFPSEASADLAEVPCFSDLFEVPLPPLPTPSFASFADVILVVEIKGGVVVGDEVVDVVFCVELKMVGPGNSIAGGIGVVVVVVVVALGGGGSNILSSLVLSRIQRCTRDGMTCSG